MSHFSEKSLLLILRLIIIGLVQGLFFITLAMVFYAGGSYMNKDAPGFSAENVLSDLGRTISISNHSNLISSIMFNISLGIVGGSYICFFIVLPQLFQNEKARQGKIFSIFGSIVGILMGCGYIGTAFTPANLVYDVHLIFGFVAFSMGLPCMIFYAIALIYHPYFPKIIVIFHIIFSILDFTFLYLLFKLMDTNQMKSGFALVQKIVVYFLILILLLQAIITRKIVLTYQSGKSVKTIEKINE